MNRLTVIEAIEKFIDEIKNIKRFSENTIESYKIDLNQFNDFCDISKKEYLDDISERFLKSYVMFLSEKRYEKSSMARKLASLRGFLKYSYQNSFIEVNPAVNLSNPKVTRKIPEVVSLDSILNIFKLSEEKEKDFQFIQAIFEMLYGCALRVSELCQLNISDVDFDRKVVRIKGKGNKMRITPIGEKSIEVLNKYLYTREKLNNNQPLFINKTGRRIYPRLIHRIVAKYLNMVTDIEKKSPHILRHTAATHMLDNGADIRVVKEILGHENLSTTQIYTRVSIERLKSAYKKSHPKS